MKVKNLLKRTCAAAFSAVMMLSSVVPVQADTVIGNFGTFENIYTAPEGAASIQATKVLEGGNLKAAQFSFELKDSEGTVIQTKKNDENGKIIFDDIEYKQVGTYTYTISEVEGDEEGVTYDDSVYTAVVEVKAVKDAESGDSKLVATVSYKDADNESVDPIFYNSYNPASVIIRATKKLEGRDLKKDEFEFELRDQSGNVVAKAKNAENGAITFDAMQFDAAGSYNYTLVEVPGTAEGITYDSTEYSVVVTVKADKKGTLVATATYSDPANTTTVIKNGVSSTTTKGSTSPVFTNTYSASGATIQAKKSLEGRDLKAGEFEFVLKDSSGKEIQTVKNGSDGSVVFDEISYSKEGTYKYTISEKNTGLANVTYDTSEFTATVTVTKQNGKISATVKYSSDPTFKNTYTEPSEKQVVVQVTAKKELEGRELRAGEFHFVLTDATGKALDTVTNNASGVVKFQNLTFYKAGVYKYYLAEQAESNVNMTYDGSIFEIVVTVTADKDGKLSATVDGNDPTFHNVYNGKDTTKKDDSSTPTNNIPANNDNPDFNTGDTNAFGVYVGLVIVGLGIMLYVFWKKWKDG